MRLLHALCFLLFATASTTPDLVVVALDKLAIRLTISFTTHGLSPVTVTALPNGLLPHVSEAAKALAILRVGALAILTPNGSLVNGLVLSARFRASPAKLSKS
jgi:hypothetical protein